MALERRYRLLPYLYTLFEQSSRDGHAGHAPRVFRRPQRRLAARRRAGVSARRRSARRSSLGENAKLPEGGWPEISLVSGDNNDPNQASLRIRPGAIIPLGKAVQNTTEKSLDPLTLLVCPDASGNATGSLYEDAGDGHAYQSGDFRRTTFRAETKDGKVVVTPTAEGSRKAECPDYVVQVVAPASK